MAPATALKSKPRASAKASAKRPAKVLSERDQEVRALARKMADEDLEKIALAMLRDIVSELKGLNADIAAQKW